ncbi:hypothetical protein WL32_36150 [Burkholderia cepacia]|nr:hypothetical protein WL32_36150 [Burkholderia cepacia]
MLPHKFDRPNKREELINGIFYSLRVTTIPRRSQNIYYKFLYLILFGRGLWFSTIKKTRGFFKPILSLHSISSRKLKLHFRAEIIKLLLHWSIQFTQAFFIFRERLEKFQI